MLKKALFFVSIFFPLLSCGFTSAEMEDSLNYVHELNVHNKEKINFNRKNILESFVLISAAIKAPRLDCDDNGENCTSTIDTFALLQGSGATVKIGKEKYLITAAHVCRPHDFDSLLHQMVQQLSEHSVEITALGFYGNESHFEIVGINHYRDLCLLKPTGKWTSPSMQMTKKEIHPGDEVYVASAPMSIFSPGMVLTFDGYYAGSDADGDMIFALVAKPGSSGSAVVNANGKIIGVIHSAYPGIENVAIGSSVDSIYAFIKENKDL